MRQINFRVWRFDDDDNWSVEINGSRHESVPLDLISQLVELALFDAEECLIATTVH